MFQMQLQLSTFENLQLQLQQNCVINYNFVNYNYNFSKLGLCITLRKKLGISSFRVLAQKKSSDLLC